MVLIPGVSYLVPKEHLQGCSFCNLYLEDFPRTFLGKFSCTITVLTVLFKAAIRISITSVRALENGAIAVFEHFTESYCAGDQEYSWRPTQDDVEGDAGTRYQVSGILDA